MAARRASGQREGGSRNHDARSSHRFCVEAKTVPTRAYGFRGLVRSVRRTNHHPLAAAIREITGCFCTQLSVCCDLGRIFLDLCSLAHLVLYGSTSTAPMSPRLGDTPGGDCGRSTPR